MYNGHPDQVVVEREEGKSMHKSTESSFRQRVLRTPGGTWRP